ncbi:energy-coupling factor transporter ATPase [bacterium c-19]|nr:energy-coupling factor transporter ATPase [bacterium c-19]
MPITFEKLTHEYNADTPFAYLALDAIDLSIEEGKITAIIGETGSGKSTLVQHLNALLLPTKGSLTVLDRTITADEKPKQLKELRKRVGLVFQFPEYQLFEETIAQDIAFGPRNFGMSEEAALKQAQKMLQVVGLSEDYSERSPFELSGGQKRRVAIAGILAMDPDVLVLDEPAAGLDPQGAKDMMELFVRLNKEYHKTILLVTHDMEHVLTYCDHVVVVDNGHIAQTCDKQQFFKDSTLLKKLRINPPAVIRLRDELNQRGFSLPCDLLDMDTLAKAIADEVKDHE